MTTEYPPINYTEEGFDLSGELTFSTASSVLDKASSHIDNIQANPIVIDFLKLEKIDSAGIALLLAWKRLCEINNKKLQINNVQKQAISLIKTNKLHTLLEIS